MVPVTHELRNIICIMPPFSHQSYVSCLFKLLVTSEQKSKTNTFMYPSCGNSLVIFESTVTEVVGILYH